MFVGICLKFALKFVSCSTIGLWMFVGIRLGQPIPCPACYALIYSTLISAIL
jgi:hypothetical protein